MQVQEGTYRATGVLETGIPAPWMPQGYRPISKSPNNCNSVGDLAARLAAAGKAHYGITTEHYGDGRHALPSVFFESEQPDLTSQLHG